MHTPEQLAEFHAAYKEWTELRERHETEMHAVVRGEIATDQEHLVEQARKVVDAHARFTAASEPFIGYGRRLRD